MSGDLTVATNNPNTLTTVSPNSIQVGPLSASAEEVSWDVTPRTSIIFGFSTKNPTELIGFGYSMDMGEDKVTLNLKMGIEYRADYAADAIIPAIYLVFLYLTGQPVPPIPEPVY